MSLLTNLYNKTSLISLLELIVGHLFGDHLRILGFG